MMKSARCMILPAAATAPALAAATTAAAAGACAVKAGAATGLTRDFAESEAFLSICQVTGNWPMQSDAIGAPSHTCNNDGALWSGRAVAKVCKG